MKRTILNFCLIAIVVILSVSIAFSAGTSKKLPFSKGKVKAEISFPVVAAAIDTLKYVVESNIATLTFFVYSPDSARFDFVYLFRVNTTAGGNILNPNVASIDTLAIFTAFQPNAAAAGLPSVAMATVTVAPSCDELWFVVDRNASNNGVTSATAYYGVYKTYYNKQ